jgi:hypothetical protein
MPDTDYEQLQLPLDHPPTDSYTVTISAGDLHDEEVLRKHTAKTPEDALSFVEALRDNYAGREHIVWQSEEPNPEGSMYGIAPKGVVYVIRVTPPIDL